VIKKLIPIILVTLSSLCSFAREEKPLERRLSVIIDPGHGGNDQGTSIQISSRLIKESDLTLKLSQKILKLINEKYSDQIKASVTRVKNDYVPLQKRIDKSKQEKIDLYLSLHYNSTFSTSIMGTEIYFPEDHKLDRRDSTILESIKQDLAETGRIKQSLNFTNKLIPHWNSDQVKIRRAPFYVLENTAIPAILIEVGYLTNPKEQKVLVSDAHQSLTAESIVKAIVEFKETRDNQLN
jgi:N-acetylmuramoyl-L-alanine amidase